MVKQGSITVDGVSLTVFDLHDYTFDIHLIPETRRSTILSSKKWATKCTWSLTYYSNMLKTS